MKASVPADLERCACSPPPIVTEFVVLEQLCNDTPAVCASTVDPNVWCATAIALRCSLCIVLLNKHATAISIKTLQ